MSKDEKMIDRLVFVIGGDWECGNIDSAKAFREWKKSAKQKITEVIRQAQLQILEEMPIKKEFECTCGCNFGDACLCKQERDGYHKAKNELIEFKQKKIK